MSAQELRRWCLEQATGNAATARLILDFVGYPGSSEFDSRSLVVALDPGNAHGWDAALSFLESERG